MVKKKTKIEIQTPGHDFIEDCIWMSYRYCIGRHTIAAAMHAPQIAKFLDANPDILSEDRKKFMAGDIRREVSDVLQWRDDVHVQGFAENVDAATLLLQHITENHLDMTQDWKFDVDLRTETVQSQPAEKKPIVSLLSDISDLLPWMKLANWLDPHEEITYEYEGERKTEPGFTIFSVYRDIAAHKVTCDVYSKNPYIDTYIADEYIIKTNNI